MAKLQEGKLAPAFKLSSTEGKDIELSQFRGKKNVILYFYPKDNTPGCTQEACDFRDTSKDFNKHQAVILGLSADSVSSHDKFRDKFSLSFPLLSDEKKQVIKKYGLWKEKSLYGKKYMGIERTTVLIDKEGKIWRVFEKVKVKGHTREVLESLQAIPQS